MPGTDGGIPDTADTVGRPSGGRGTGSLLFRQPNHRVSPLNVQFNNTSTGAVSYYWDLGNGNTSTLANPSNTYTVPGTYTIRLVAIDGAGNRDTLTRVNYITVVGQPSADFSSSVRSSCLDNNSYSFSNLSTGAVSYLWDFGDGTTSTQSNPTHSYAMSGVFTVTLIATNSFGCQDVEIKTPTSRSSPSRMPPSRPPLLPVAIRLRLSSFPIMPGEQLALELRRRHHGQSTNPSHVFASPGTYNVSLIVTNAFGCSDTSDVPAEINVGVANWATFNALLQTPVALRSPSTFPTRTPIFKVVLGISVTGRPPPILRLPCLR